MHSYFVPNADPALVTQVSQFIDRLCRKLHKAKQGDFVERRDRLTCLDSSTEALLQQINFCVVSKKMSGN